MGWFGWGLTRRVAHVVPGAEQGPGAETVPGVETASPQDVCTSLSLKTISETGLGPGFWHMFVLLLTGVKHHRSCPNFRLMLYT